MNDIKLVHWHPGMQVPSPTKLAQLPVYPVAFAPEQPGTPNEPGQAPTIPGTPATPQPADPTEGGSVGPAIPGVPLGEPQKNPDPGIEQHPHRAPQSPPIIPGDVT